MRRPVQSLRPRAPLSSTTSASTVGRPRESHTRLPMTAAMTSPCEPDERRPPLSRVLHARRTPPRRVSRMAREHRPRNTPDRILRRSSVRYSTGDFPSTRARNSAGSRCAARCSSASAGSQSTPARYASVHASNDDSSSLLGRRNPQRLQQQMVEAKGQIEGGVAEPRALGIEKHRTARAEKNILRTDVSMHDRELRPRGALRQRLENRRKIRMRARRRQQIRFDAQVMERRVGVEVRRPPSAISRRRHVWMRAAGRPSRLSPESRSRARAATSTSSYRSGEQILHRERSNRRDPTRAPPAPDRSQAFATSVSHRTSASVSRDIGAPVGGDAQAVERLLHAELRGARAHQPDIGRHASRERFEPRTSPGEHKPGSLEKCRESPARRLRN